MTGWQKDAWSFTTSSPSKGTQPVSEYRVRSIPVAGRVPRRWDTLAARALHAGRSTTAACDHANDTHNAYTMMSWVLHANSSAHHASPVGFQVLFAAQVDVSNVAVGVTRGPGARQAQAGVQVRIPRWKGERARGGL